MTMTSSAVLANSTSSTIRQSCIRNTGVFIIPGRAVRYLHMPIVCPPSNSEHQEPPPSTLRFRTFSFSVQYHQKHMRGFLIVWIRCLQATAGLSVFGSVVVRTGGAGISQGFFHQCYRMDLNHLHIARGLERSGWVSTGGGWAGATTWVGSNISSILDAPDRDSHQSSLTKTVISH